ncbi:MAG: DNA repair protein RadA, partial [Oscillospiraceae bacterium]
FIPGDTVVFGEIGLGGEVRSVVNVDLRLREIQRLGFKNAIIPNHSLKQIDVSDYSLQIFGVSNIKQAIHLI